MSLEPSVGSEVISDSRNLRIHTWISNISPTDFVLQQRSSSISRADSPLLGFTLQENASPDPLYRPSPNYLRRLPEGALPDSNDKPSLAPFSDARIPPVVLEDTEQDILLPSLTRNRPLHNQNRYFAHLSPLRSRPSLPVIRSSVPSALPSHQTFVLPRARSHHVVLHRPAVAFASQPATRSPLPPPLENDTPTPAAPVPPELERQKLNALVIASGLADEDELRANGPSNNSSPSRVYSKEPNRVVPAEVESSRDTENYASSVAAQAQLATGSHSPRASFSLHDLDEFDDDASYYGKEMDPLFSPYSTLASGSKAISPVSKWSLSSSVEDLRSKRSSTSKTLKSKGEKIKSFISRFSSNGPSSSGDKHVLSFPVDEEKPIRRQRSHSDVLESIAGRSSVSSRDPPLAYASWESAPATPSTTQSTTSISISTTYSPATPSDNDDGSSNYPSSGRRYSDEKSPTGKTASPGESPISLTRHTSSSSLTWPGTRTSVAHDSSVTPLEHSISSANLKAHGLKGFVSKIGLTPAEGLHEESSSGRENAPKEEKPSASVPRTFRERMMLKNNGSALSLILGKSGNKATKPKRKLLISGIEQGNYKKYEAISSWCEGFGKVTVDHKNNGTIVADFKDVNVAHTVCRLQARVHIKGAGSVNLSWTTEE